MLLVREYPKTLEKNRREMMKRTIKKQVWLNRTEARELQKKAKKACLSEAGLVLTPEYWEAREDAHQRIRAKAAAG